MKVLVTGVAGFIGFHLARKLAEQRVETVGVDSINDYYDVNLKYARLQHLGISKSFIEQNRPVESTLFDSLSFIKLNLALMHDLQTVFEGHEFTHVVHLAAQPGVRYSLENPFAYVNSNLVAFANILECCRKHEIDHLVFASSSSVYGNSRKVPFSEQEAVEKPVSFYAATKKSNELMAYTYSHLYNLQITGLRFFTVYGPWGRPDMAPMLFADAIVQNQPINVFNEGNMKRDFTYIDDIVEGIIKTLKYKNTAKPAYEIFNIGNSSPVDLMRFIELMEKELGIQANKNMMPMQPGDVEITYADTTKLQAKTGYAPSTTLERGLQHFVNWYQDFYGQHK